jgi:hypothetical protein
MIQYEPANFWIQPNARRRHHRQPRDRAAGEHRAPPGPVPSPVTRRGMHRNQIAQVITGHSRIWIDEQLLARPPP